MEISYRTVFDSQILVNDDLGDPTLAALRLGELAQRSRLRRVLNRLSAADIDGRDDDYSRDCDGLEPISFIIDDAIDVITRWINSDVVSGRGGEQ